MYKISSAAFYLLTIAVLAVFMPRLYDSLVFTRIENTHVFYSPVSKRFIYTERAAFHDPAAAAKAEDHHSDIVYKDQDGIYYDRLEFERLLPFIYYRNMELRGYLPLQLDGRILDKAVIRQERQVLEVNSATLAGPGPDMGIYPLFEAQSGQAGLVFPDDRFRMAADAMEFVNADYNSVDAELSGMFTSALLKEGFVFPARTVAGNFTILKSFDDGVFIVDANHSVFHVRRAEGRPLVVKTPVPRAVRARYIKVVENEDRRYHGLLFGEDNSVYLFSGGYGLIKLPLAGYNPDRMDLKLIFDPLYRTAVWSDRETARATAMDKDFKVLARYEHHMSRALRTWKHKLRDALFPFSVRLDDAASGQVGISMEFGKYWSNFSILLGLGLFVAYMLYRRMRFKRPFSPSSCLVICLTGIYGLIACFFIEEQ